MTPWLDEFMDAHPKLSLRVNISDSRLDFYRDAVDMALRYGPPSDSNLYGFKICNVRGLLCATREYLARHGTPAHPHDLAAHHGLFYQLYDVVHDVWEFSRGEAQYKVKMSGNRASNDGDLVRRWCVAGQGLAVKSCRDISSELLAGNLVNILPVYRAKSTELWLVCPSRQSITPAVRLLRDFFRKKCTGVLRELVTNGCLDEGVFD